MSDRELEEIIDAVALRNDVHSFKKLYYFYFNKLYSLAISIVKSAEEAEEVVNDTLLSIWNHRAQLREVRNFKTYLFTAVRNKAINALAKMKPYQHLNLEETEAVFYTAHQNAEDKINSDDLVNILNRSVEKLSPQCRLIFKLVKENGFKHKEVAELLNLSVKSVEYHIGTALKKIWENFVASNTVSQKKLLKNNLMFRVTRKFPVYTINTGNNDQAYLDTYRKKT